MISLEIDMFYCLRGSSNINSQFAIQYIACKFDVTYFNDVIVDEILTHWGMVNTLNHG